METISIVFFGSGPVAAKCLELLRSTFHVEAIVTKPSTAILMQRACPSTPIHTVAKRKDLDTLVATKTFSSPCGVIIDFGIIVSNHVIESFPSGIINSHFSLLPQWRGADPITFAILSGQKTTGISIMLLNEGMDEGPLLAQAPYDIPLNVTNPDLSEALIQLSDATLKEVLPQYIAGTIIPAPQEVASLLRGTAPTYSRKITKDDGKLNWEKPAVQLEREVRAFITWPKSHTRLADREVIITKATVSDRTIGIGEILADNKRLFIGCGDGRSLEVLSLKPAGKAEMDIAAFLAGYRRFLI
jgi:methionyl-tRNA formyltransferase